MPMMSDEEFMFHKDVLEKKSTGRSAYCKGKSGRRGLSNGYKTDKELAKMNSEIVTYDLKHFYTYEEFKKMPKDIQVEYLQKLTDTWHVGSAAISAVLFELNRTALDQHLKKFLLKDKIKWNAQSGYRASIANEAFRKAVEEARTVVEVKEEPVEEIKTEVVNIVEEPKVEKPKKTRKIAKKEPKATIVEEPKVDSWQSVKCPAVPSYWIDPNNLKASVNVEEPPKSKAKLLNATMVFDGFDPELFAFFAKRYEGQEVVVNVTVTPKT